MSYNKLKMRYNGITKNSPKEDIKSGESEQQQKQQQKQMVQGEKNSKMIDFYLNNIKNHIKQSGLNQMSAN